MIRCDPVYTGRAYCDTATTKFNQRFTSTGRRARRVNCLRQVHDAMWSKVPPVKSTAPQLIAWVPEMAAALGIDIDTDKTATAEVFTGTRTPAGTLPYAMRYGGHQFGNWAGQLGDGRAIALGELPDQHGKLWTLQLKGGPTPYSRQETAMPCCDLPFANICVPKPCTTSAYPPLAL